MMIHTHPHPGEYLKEMVLDPLGLSVTEAAKRLSIARPSLSKVLNGRGGISPSLAVRLEKAGVGAARFWINLQANYDLWRVMKQKQPPIRALYTKRQQREAALPRELIGEPA